jgi:5-methylthioribose kinase
MADTQLQIDIEEPSQLRAYLVRRGFVASGEEVTVENLRGGVSNRTVYVRTARGEFVLKQALQKLRVAVDWFSDPKRIHREAMGLNTIAELVPGSTPELVFEDEPQNLLAMRAVPSPHQNWKSVLLSEGPGADHVRQFAELLAAIHRRAFEQRDRLKPLFADRSFFESLRIEPYYQYAAAQVPAAASFIDELVRATRATSVTLVHGDYSPKNILIHGGELILLDHEVIHWGDPGFDIGFSMAHLLSKAHHCVERRRAFIDAATTYWAGYHEEIGDVPWKVEVESAGARHTLGCLLARCRGRSPLEYLTEFERTRQAGLVLELMQRPPAMMRELIARFAEKL